MTAFIHISLPKQSYYSNDEFSVLFQEEWEVKQNLCNWLHANVFNTFELSGLHIPKTEILAAGKLAAYFTPQRYSKSYNVDNVTGCVPYEDKRYSS